MFWTALHNWADLVDAHVAHHGTRPGDCGEAFHCAVFCNFLDHERAVLIKRLKLAIRELLVQMDVILLKAGLFLSVDVQGTHVGGGSSAPHLSCVFVLVSLSVLRRFPSSHLLAFLRLRKNLSVFQIQHGKSQCFQTTRFFLTQGFFHRAGLMSTCQKSWFRESMFRQSGCHWLWLHLVLQMNWNKLQWHQSNNPWWCCWHFKFNSTKIFSLLAKTFDVEVLEVATTQQFKSRQWMNCCGKGNLEFFAFHASTVLQARSFENQQSRVFIGFQKAANWELYFC